MMPARSRPLAAIFAAVLVLLSAAPAAGAHTMVVQADGKIVLGGSVFPRFAGLVRFDANGTLDPAFGDDGVVIERRLGPLNAIALQPDGRILFAASRFGSGTSPSRAGASAPAAILGRYLADGSADQGFGVAGLASSPIEPVEGAQPNAIVPRPDGSIALATTHCCFKYAPPSFASVELFSAAGAFTGELSRLNDGSASGYPFRNYALYDLIPSTGDSLVGVGSGPPIDPAKPETGILTARFQAGTPKGYDPSFGKEGGIVIGPPQYGMAATEGQGRIVVAGLAGSLSSGNNHGIVLRYDPDGALDSGFAAAGRFDLNLPDSVFSRLNEVAVAPDGSVVAVGYAYSGLNRKYSYGPCEGCLQAVVVKLTPDGALDPSFGEGGIVRLGGAGGVPAMEAMDLAILGDGRMLVSGATEGEFPSFVLARLTPNGVFDPTFGQGGLAVTSICAGNRSHRIRAGCLPKPRLGLRIQHLRSHRPVLRLRIEPNVPWAGIVGARLIMPRALRLHPGRIERRGGLRAHVAGQREVKPVVHPVGVNFSRLGSAPSITLKLAAGAFTALRPLGRRGRIVFRVKVKFDVGPYPEQAVVIRRQL
jgi:uncharacterized delta-60 repeat protein